MPNNNNPRMATDEVVEAVAHELCSEIGSDSINHAFQWDDYIRYAKAALSVIASKAVGGELVERTNLAARMTAAIEEANPELGWDTANRYAHAALSSLPPQSAPVEGWRDIETAPKDGEVILVYRADAGVFPAHYVEARESSGYEVGDECWFSVFGEDLTGDLPTHWQPLPLPPNHAAPVKALPPHVKG